MVKFNKIHLQGLLDTHKYPNEIVGRFNSFITTQFDDSLSVEMQMRSIMKWLQENLATVDNNTSMINSIINDLVNYLNRFIDEFDDNLVESVRNLLNEWLANGTLVRIINEDVFNMKANQSDMDEVVTQLAHKVDEVVHNIATGNLEFYGNGLLLHTLSLVEVGNTGAVQSYIDTLISNGQIQGIQVADGSITTRKLQDRAVDESKTTFIEKSTNLVDHSKTEYGNFNSDTGEDEFSLNFAITPFIKVNPSTDYNMYNGLKVGRYDAAQNYLNQTSLSAEGKVVRMNASTHYIRVVSNASQNAIQSVMVSEGAEQKPFEPFYYRINGVDMKNLINPEKTDDNGEHTPIDVKTYDEYTTPIPPRDLYTHTGAVGNTQYTRSQQFSLYNEIRQNHPTYVRERVHGSDRENNPLISYVFEPEQVNNQSIKTKFPTIILVSGVHGDERAGVYNLYNAMNMIANRWKEHPVLEFLRWHVRFIVAPIVNPTGYDVSSRKNHRGVDIARNFPEGFRVISDTSSQTYGGQSALSEPEAQFVADIIDETENVIYFGSIHNMWSAESFIWNASATTLQVNLGKQIVSQMTQKWKKEHSWFPQENSFFAGYSDMGSPQGSESMYAMSKGIQASTFEMSARVGFHPTENNSFNPVSMNLGTELLVNWLSLVVEKNTQFYNKLNG